MIPCWARYWMVSNLRSKEKASHKQKPSSESVNPRNVTNVEFEIGRSRLYDILSAKEEQKLTGWVTVIVAVLALALIAFEYSGGAGWFISLFN